MFVKERTQSKHMDSTQGTESVRDKVIKIKDWAQA